MPSRRSRARRPNRALFAALPSALLTALLSACSGSASPPPEAEDGPIPVAASVPPAGWLAERIGGERVAVTTLLPPGRSPHTWEPAPRELMALSRARLVVVVGHPALPFEDRLLAAARRDGEPLVVAISDGIELLPDTGHDHEGDDEHGHGEGRADRSRLAATDPHVWLDPEAMRAAAGRIAGALSALDPDHAGEYSERLAALEAEIAALDRDLRALLEPLPERRFLAYHPAWGYFAARYGLVQEAVEVGGKEPGTRGLVERVAAARARGARTVFVQASDSGRGARVIAEEIGGEAVTLDSLAYDWDDNLRRVAAAMAAALGAAEPATPAEAAARPESR